MSIAHGYKDELTVAGTVRKELYKISPAKTSAWMGKGFKKVPSMSEELSLAADFRETERWCSSGVRSHAQVEGLTRTHTVSTKEG